MTGGTLARALVRAPLAQLVAIFLVVAGAEGAFGLWMDSRGFLYTDAYSRAVSALLVLHAAHPHLSAIGFVWMPLPGLLDMLWSAWYPLWPAVVASGFASTATSALASGALAALLVATARRLGLSPWLGWAYALLIAANPMLLLYGSNGLSEGVAAPFLVGAVCALTIFWRFGQRSQIALAGLAVALGVASRYEAVLFEAGLVAALVVWTLRGTDGMVRYRWRTAEGLGILLVAPSCYVMGFWIGSNAIFMHDPLFFATSPYADYMTSWTGAVSAQPVAGHLLGSLGFVAIRVAPFLIPTLFVLGLRMYEQRFWRAPTLCLVVMLASVPFGLILPLVYRGESYGGLRLFLYPLFVAAGWGLYEIATSQHRRAAIAVVLIGWVVAAPCTLMAMANPSLGQEEHWEVQAIFTGQTAAQAVLVNHHAQESSLVDPEHTLPPVATFLERTAFAPGQTLALDPATGYALLALLPPDDLRYHILVTSDPTFLRAVRQPQRYHLTFLLVADPARVTQDAIAQLYPNLWSGYQPGFELVATFPETAQGWRLYRVLPVTPTPGRGPPASGPS